MQEVLGICWVHEVVVASVPLRRRGGPVGLLEGLFDIFGQLLMMVMLLSNA